MKGGGEGGRGRKISVPGVYEGCDWNFLLTSAFSASNFQPLNGSNFWTTCPIWMSNSSLESYYVVVFKYYAFEHLSCDSFADVSSFSLISEKISLAASFKPIWRHMARFFKKERKFFRVWWNKSWLIFLLIGLFLSKLKQSNKKNSFWIIIEKICLHQQKMNPNDAIIFWYFVRTTL